MKVVKKLKTDPSKIFAIIQKNFAMEMRFGLNLLNTYLNPLLRFILKNYQIINLIY